MSNFSTEFFTDLTPLSDETVDKDNAYCKSIDWAINNPNIKNLAITGVYGSGKSSILQKYEKKYSKQKKQEFLNISLSYFDNSNNTYKNIENKSNDNNTKPDRDSNLDDTNKKQNKSLLTSEIEQGILQQLFYTHDPKTTPFSRFKRIKPISNFMIFISSAAIVVFCVLLLATFGIEFSILKVCSIIASTILLCCINLFLVRRC